MHVTMFDYANCRKVQSTGNAGNRCGLCSVPMMRARRELETKLGRADDDVALLTRSRNDARSCDGRSAASTFNARLEKTPAA